MFFPLYDDNPTLRRPLITQSLIALNLLFWIGFQGAGLDPEWLEESMEILGLPPTVLFPDDYDAALLTFLIFGFTSMFSHASWIHLVGNMWFLWIFGNNVEDSMSRRRFLLLYLLAGYAGCLMHSLMASPSYLVGASGAVSGVSVAYLLLFPKCRIYSALVILRFIWVFRIPAFVLIGAHTFVDISSIYMLVDDGVAYWAHIGGIAAAFSLIWSLVDRDRLIFHPYHGWKVSLPENHELSSSQKTMLQRASLVLTLVVGLFIFYSTLGPIN